MRYILATIISLSLNYIVWYKVIVALKNGDMKNIDFLFDKRSGIESARNLGYILSFIPLARVIWSLGCIVVIGCKDEKIRKAFR